MKYRFSSFINILNSGFHYIGNNLKKNETEKLINLIGSNDIEFNNFKHFDRIMHSNEIFDFIAPSQTFFKNLVKKFPD